MASATTSAIRIELVVGDDERRPEQDRVAVDAVRVAGARVHEHTTSARGRDDRLGQPGLSPIRLARGPIRDELQADHQAATADLPDRRVAPEPIEQQPGQSFPLRRARLDQVLVVQDAQDLAGDRRPDRAHGRT